MLFVLVCTDCTTNLLPAPVTSEYGEIRSISPYLSRMRENVDQNNSEYGHFLRSGSHNHYSQSVLNFTCHRGCRGSSVILSSCLREYFVGLKYFLVGISWSQSFFSQVFRWSKDFSRGYFVIQRFFLVGISWARNFFLWVQNSFLWVISLFTVVGRMKKRSTEIYLKLHILFQIDFSKCKLSLYQKDTSSIKLLMLLRNFSL